MKTKFLLFTILIIGSVAAYSQTTPSTSTKANLEKAKANPKIKEQQAKADVHVVKKTNTIVDTSPKKYADTTRIGPSQKKNKKIT